MWSALLVGLVSLTVAGGWGWVGQSRANSSGSFLASSELALSGSGIDAGTGGVPDPLAPVDSGAIPASATLSSGVSPTTSRKWSTSGADIVSDPALVGQLDEVLVGVDGAISVAVQDLASGRGAVLDGDREQPAASLYKLPVLYTVFDLGLSMNEPLLITEDARSYDSGSMELGAGETLTVAEALERMVTLSDNTSAVMLSSRVGSMRINANTAALGLGATHFSLDRMTTSTLDMVHLIGLIARGEAVSPAASADMIHLLLRQRVNDRLPRLLPDSVQVAHKTGNLPGIVNDVGLLYGPRSTIAVAALVSDTTDEVAAATAIARLAQVAYAYFDAQPEEPARPTIPPAPSRAVPPVWRQPRPVPPTATPASPAVNLLETAPAARTTPPAGATVVPPTRAAVPLQATAAALATPGPAAAPTTLPSAPTAQPNVPATTQPTAQSAAHPTALAPAAPPTAGPAAPAAVAPTPTTVVASTTRAPTARPSTPAAATVAATPPGRH